jgi:hypothetical protein
LLSADINKKGFAEGGSTGVQGPGLINSLLDSPGNSLLDSSSVANRQYIIDPVTGDVILNPNVRRKTFANMVGSGGRDDREDPNPGWTNMSDADKAAFMRENPMYSSVTQFGQKALRYMPGGIGALMGLQKYLAPDFVRDQEMIAMGLNPNQNFNVPGFDYSGDYDSFASDRAAVDSARPGLVDGGLRDPQQRAEMAAEAAASQQRDDDSRDIGGGGYSESATSQQRGEKESGNPDPGGYAGYDSGRPDFAAGGLLGLAKGGMRSGGFVIPADVVSMVGEGNTDAGYKRIKSMVPGAVAIKGKDGGQSDTVKTSIEGKQRARVAHGEMYIPPETVKRMGGAKKLYAMMDRVRQQATGSKRQIKPVSLKRAMA